MIEQNNKIVLEKQCSACRVKRKTTEFNLNKTKKFGVSNECKKCSLNRSRKFRDKHRTDIAKYKKEYYKKNKQQISNNKKKRYRTIEGISKYLYFNSKNRAKKNNIVFSITKRWVKHQVEEHMHCPIRDVKFITGEYTSDVNSRTLDRYDQKLGYTFGNTILISHLANTVKNNGTIIELKLLINYLDKLKKINFKTWIEKIRYLNLETKNIFFISSGREIALSYRIFHDAKKRAKKKGIPFSILQKDILFPNICPILDISLKKGTRRQTDNSPTLDRIDNTKGYTPNNIQIISCKSNRMKSSCSLDELKQIYEGFIKYKQLNSI